MQSQSLVEGVMSKAKARTEFWNDWSSKSEASGQPVRFMLGIDDCNEAMVISQADLTEIIALLPDLSGMEVLELASGVG